MKSIKHIIYCCVALILLIAGCDTTEMALDKSSEYFRFK